MNGQRVAPNRDSLYKALREAVLARAAQPGKWQEILVHCATLAIRNEIRAWAQREGITCAPYGRLGMEAGVYLYWGDRCPIQSDTPDLVVGPSGETIGARS